MFLVVVFVSFLSFSSSHTVLNNAGRASSFSSAIKGFQYVSGKEVILYENSFKQPGHITEQWFTGPAFDDNAHVKVYIDNEPVASLTYNLYMAHSIDKDHLGSPWSTRLFGHIANNGGVFNTHRIPFTSSVKITVENDKTSGALWYIVRGFTGVNLTIGNFHLPVETRLKIYKFDNIVKPLEFITLSKSTDTSGMVFLVNFNVKSTTSVFMEGCFRALIDGSSTVSFLSSGTEDFFLSAYYFETGTYQGYQSGLTSFTKTANDTEIFAYKVFVDDPIIFSESLELIWRNFETRDGDQGCPSSFPQRKQETHLNEAEVAPAHIKSYVWVYEWPYHV